MLAPDSMTILLFAGVIAVLLVSLLLLFRSQQTLQQRLLSLSLSEAGALERASGLQRQVELLSVRQREFESENQELQQIRVRLETEMRALSESLDNERRQITDAKQNLQDSFKSLAATALEGNNRQFIELAKATLAKESEMAKGDLEKRQLAIDGLLLPFRETLERFQSQAQQLETERQRSYTTVESELRRVVEASQTLSKQTAALKDALKRPHVRGRWGEVQLRNCIELSGMSEFADVNFQDVSVDDDGTRLIPDMTVRMPGSRFVVVDAKTPIDAFISSLEATTDEARATEMLRHGRQVKDHVKKLSTRAYNEGLKDSADFTVLFLPNESFLYAALETQPDLVEYALQKKILIATPPTLIGLLKVIRFGWNEEKLAQNAQEISDAAIKLHKRLADFVEAFEDVGLHLEKAKSQFEVGRKRLHSQVLVQARRLEALGTKSNKEIEIDESLLTSSSKVIEISSGVTGTNEPL